MINLCCVIHSVSILIYVIAKRRKYTNQQKTFYGRNLLVGDFIYLQVPKLYQGLFGLLQFFVKIFICGL
jgi:hypothetical protein